MRRLVEPRHVVLLGPASAGRYETSQVQIALANISSQDYQTTGRGERRKEQLECTGFARRTAAGVQASLRDRDDDFITEVDALGGIQELLYHAEIISEQHDFYNRLKPPT